MRLAGIILLALCSSAGATWGQETAAQWIWFPENPSADCIQESRWFRKTFRLPEAPVAASLWLMIDDSGRLYINGHEAPEAVEQGRAWQRYDLTKILVAGENVLALQAKNATGPAGVLARLVIRRPNGQEILICSDGTWRASREEPPAGWQALAFEDRGWQPVRVLGSAFTAPWYEHPLFDLRPFITPAEQQAYEHYRETLLAPPERFAAEPPARASIRPYNGAPALFLNGRPYPLVMYRASLDPLSEYGRRLIASFRDAGVHLYAPYVALASCWPAPGKYDWRFLEAQLRAYLAVDPDAYLIVLVRLVPPDWWMQAHPEENVRYATSDSIDSSDEAGRVLRPSLASEAWRHDVGEAWRALIRYVEAQPWGKRVIGWHACYGIYCEWHYFGSWTEQYPDIGPAMTKAFRAYLRQRYGTDAHLQRAWSDPHVTFSTATVPGVAPRRDGTLASFRDPRREQRVIDYYRCQQKITADAIEYFGRIAKQETRGRALYGVYYGYFMGVPPQTQGGHLELLRLLQSPTVDYFVAPYDYGHRLMGMDGRLRSLAAAFNLAGKAHIIEADTRTHLHPREEHGRLANLAESLAAIRREFSTALLEHTGYWFVDFGPEGVGGWYDDPQIMALVKQLYEWAKRALSIPRHLAAEVALIADLESAYYLSDGEGMKTAYRLITDTTTELYHTGVAFDAFFLPQLARADLSRYKVLIFLNTTAMTDAQAAYIERLRRAGRHSFVFLWAPGYTGPDGISLARVARLTGFRMAAPALRASGRVIITQPEHPLVRDLPETEQIGLEIKGTTPVLGFSARDNWHNPRSERYMQEHYQGFDVQSTKDGVIWRFATTDSWSDVHWQGEINAADGLGLRVRASSDLPVLSLRCVIKDANFAEFVSPSESLPRGEWRELRYALPAFANAPWSRLQPPQPAFPLRGMKFVLDGVGGAGLVTLELENLMALHGELRRTKTKTFGEGFFGPVVAPIRQAGIDFLGHLAGQEEARFAVRKEGPQWTLYCPAPYLPREILSVLFVQVGVHRYDEDPRDVVRADSYYVAIHTKEGGARRLHFPGRGPIYDALTGALLGDGPLVEMTLPPTSTTIFEFGTP